jgi:hypothetical protein
MNKINFTKPALHGIKTAAQQVIQSGISPKTEEKVQKVLQQNPQRLYKFPPCIKDNKQCVLTPVTKHGFSLEDASDRLNKKNKGIVEATTRNEPSALAYASEELQRDEDLLNLSDEIKQRNEKVRHTAAAIHGFITGLLLGAAIMLDVGIIFISRR